MYSTIYSSIQCFYLIVHQTDQAFFARVTCYDDSFVKIFRRCDVKIRIFIYLKVQEYWRIISNL